MRLVRYTGGLFTVVKLPPLRQEIELYLRNAAAANGNIDYLALDFAGAYVPLLSVDEVRLAAALLAVYTVPATPIDPPRQTVEVASDQVSGVFLAYLMCSI
jgi:hypothetical protein